MKKQKLPRIETSDKVTVLALSWRDIRAPKAGGAEVHTHEMLRGCDHERIRVFHFSPLFPGAKSIEIIDDVCYLRSGNIISVILQARSFYRCNAANIDYVIDQCNTHRFFTPLWVPTKKRIFYIHQLTREIWDVQAKFPLSTIGRLMETPMLRLNRKDRAAITVSESTRQDLVSVGFAPEKVWIIPNALSTKPLLPEQFLKKTLGPVFIYAGRFAPYKGIDAAVKALGIIKENYPNAKLWCIGKADRVYIDETLHPLCQKYALVDGNPQENGDVTYWGFVSEQKKLELLSSATALLFPSMREGWGIIVIEAASVGTPSIVYDSPGCRDAVDFGRAGYLCGQNTPAELAKYMKDTVEKPEEYEAMRRAAYQFATGFSWPKSAQLFSELILKLNEEDKTNA